MICLSSTIHFSKLPAVDVISACKSSSAVNLCSISFSSLNVNKFFSYPDNVRSFSLLRASSIYNIIMLIMSVLFQLYSYELILQFYNYLLQFCLMDSHPTEAIHIHIRKSLLLHIFSDLLILFLRLHLQKSTMFNI